MSGRTVPPSRRSPPRRRMARLLVTCMTAQPLQDIVDIKIQQLYNLTMKTRKTREPHLPPMAPLTVRFPIDDLAAMRRLAKENHRSLNAEIVHAVAEYIRQQSAASDVWENGEERG